MGVGVGSRVGVGDGAGVAVGAGFGVGGGAWARDGKEVSVGKGTIGAGVDAGAGDRVARSGVQPG